MRHVLGLLVATLISVSPALAIPDDDNYPPMRDEFLRQIISGKAGSAFLDQDFASIDTVTDLYLKTSAKTPAGIWKLGLVYDGFDSLANDEHGYEINEHLAERWLAQIPKSSAAHIAFSEILISHAYFLRGNGPVSDASSSELSQFRSYIERARTVLESCESFCTTQPDWYVNMMQIANLQNWDKKKFTSLFEEANAKFPDYLRIYNEGAMYFSPLSHGSADELDTFVQNALDKTKSSEGTILYGRIYDNVMRRSGYACGCLRMQWWRMFNAFIELNRKYPDSWNENEFAWQACVNGDRISYKMAMANIPKEPPNWKIWGSQEILEICQKWSTDKFGPPGSPFNQPHQSIPKATTTL